MKAVRIPCILVVAVLALLLIAGIRGGQSLARSLPVTRLVPGMPATAATAARNTIEDVFARPNQTGWGMTTNPDGVANVAWGMDGDGTHSYVTISGNTGVYPRLSNYLVLGDTATKQVIRQIGPVQNGVRPFTVNGQGTLAFIETSGFIGFDVAAIATGKTLWKVPVPGYSYDPTSLNAPAHGISLSPDEKELYISDWPYSMVHVFAVSGLPTRRPRWLANIPVHNMVGSESPCVGSNCQKEGWVLHSRDGRFVYVGDAGDVIDTTTRRSVGYLPSLANTRKYIEIDWENGIPIATTTRYGLGYVTN